MDKNKIESLIKWWKETDTQGIPYVKYFIEPLMKAFGDDVDEILEYLDNMDVKDLDFISGAFEYIYGKFTTEDVWDALEKLEQKIA